MTRVNFKFNTEYRMYIKGGSPYNTNTSKAARTYTDKITNVNCYLLTYDTINSILWIILSLINSCVSNQCFILSVSVRDHQFHCRLHQYIVRKRPFCRNLVARYLSPSHTSIVIQCRAPTSPLVHSSVQLQTCPGHSDLRCTLK